MQDPSTELKNTTYELFIAALSVLSIVNLFLLYLIPDPTVEQTVVIMDRLLSLVFLADFAYRFLTAEKKGRYFFRQAGWADLLASLSLPQFKLLRLFRIVRAARLMRKYGVTRMIRTFVDNRAQSALLTLLFLIMLVLEFGGMGMVWAEAESPNSNIRTAGDALWYTYVTITTVGYGDRYPVTPTGRVLGMIIMGSGVGLFGTLTGFLANAFLAPKKKPEETVAVAGSQEPEARPVEPQPDAKARLAELQQLLAEQQRAQAALQAKIAEIEALL